MEYNIAFSSSGVRFAAHVGVLAYLQDNNIKIKNYSGTSGGAVVAAWGANNLPARKLMDLTLQFGYAKFFLKPSLGLAGILDHSSFIDSISAHCTPKKNLWIVTFNILKMQKEVWNGQGFSLSKILAATTSIPGLFKPVMYSNGLHIDGIFGRFCPDDLWDEGVTFSVQLKSKKKTKSRYPFDSFVHEIEKATIDFLYENQKKKNRDAEIIYIQPDVSSIAQMDLFLVNEKDHLELFKKGYEAAKKVLETNFSSISSVA
ncbi:MAG: patatin-like phospholipase family protein [Candidatus Melainabacteria bacterium]|nr:patatin-like phospholipase family protein [Candidatus Melainabacteria bacterium]